MEPKYSCINHPEAWKTQRPADWLVVESVENPLSADIRPNVYRHMRTQCEPCSPLVGVCK